jgi:RNA polymerase sigma factor (sigma-70 family)
MPTETPTQALYRRSAMQVEFERIQAGDEQAVTDFYRLFRRRTAFYVQRYCFQDIGEDVQQEAFLAVLEAIRKGSIRNQASIWSFAATTIKFVASCMGNREQRYVPQVDSVLENTLVDSCANPEKQVERASELQAIKNALACLSPLDREILQRFYLEEQTKE